MKWIFMCGYVKMKLKLQKEEHTKPIKQTTKVYILNYFVS